MVESHITLRVCPNTLVNGASGTRCSRVRSSASNSSGARPVSRCALALTSPQNPAHACSSSAKLRYASRRFTRVGTRSRLASRTVASTPPLDSGSAGTQVVIVMP